MTWQEFLDFLNPILREGIQEIQKVACGRFMARVSEDPMGPQRVMGCTIGFQPGSLFPALERGQISLRVLDREGPIFVGFRFEAQGLRFEVNILEEEDYPPERGPDWRGIVPENLVVELKKLNAKIASMLI